MIDLSQNREDLLAVIGASADLLEGRAVDPGSEEFRALDEAYFEIHAHTREEILPLMRNVLQERFEWISPARLFHDLLLPLKRGLGNAYKRGNVANAQKWIRARVAVTRSGVFVEIGDEGEGFDVEEVLGRFRNSERYFTHGGAGFDTLERSMASVSYADGGRTLLIAYCCTDDHRAGALASADDELFMTDVLQNGLPMLKKGRGRLESLRIGPPGTPTHPRRRELGYELGYREGGSDADRTRTLWLTGRILEPDAAQTDHAVAKVLAQGPFRQARSIRIPESLSAFKGQPQVVLYPLWGVGDLRRYLAQRSELERQRAVARIAEGLGTLHRSGLKPVRRRPLQSWLEARASALADLVLRFEELRPESCRALSDVVSRLAVRAERLVEPALVPIHGRFDWDCVLHEGDTLFFYEFEHTCAAHPHADLGGFLADLRVYGPELDAGFSKAAERTFLATYGPEEWGADLEFFVAHAALLRLEACSDSEIDAWLGVAESAA